MRKWIALLTAGLLSVGLTGYQSAENSVEQTEQTGNAETAANEQTEQTADAEAAAKEQTEQTDDAETAVNEQAAESEELQNEWETDSDSESESEGEKEVEEVAVKTVSDGTMEMDYCVFGSGDRSFVIIPGLSVHSVMGSADAIAGAYSDFTDDYTVYVFDRAKNIQEGYTVRDMADDTAAAMEALGLSAADVFGASQGGMIAQYLAIDHPELVNKLILGSTLAKPNDTFQAVAGEWITLAEEKDETGLLESFVDSVYSEATLKDYRDTLISSNRGITDEEYERFLILTKACLSFDSSAELSKIQCPVLVLGCEGDQVVTAEGSRQLAEALDCELYLYEDSYGHGVYDEAPDYRQRCLDFLGESDAEQGEAQ